MDFLLWWGPSLLQWQILCAFKQLVFYETNVTFSSHLLYQYQHTFYILINTNLCLYVNPPIHTKVSYPSVFLSYIVGVRLVQTVIHPLQVVTHSTPQAGAFPETNIPFIMYISIETKFFLKLRCVWNILSQTMKKSHWPLTLKMILILYWPWTFTT